MLFNNDLLFVVGSILVGGIFTYSFYNNIFTTYNSESLVNTLPQLDSINLTDAYPVLQPNVLHKIDVGVQTDSTALVDSGVQATTIHVDTGIQTSSRIWYETVKNWLMEILSMRDSELQGNTPTEIRVENWIDHLDNTQIVSTNTMNSVVSQGLPNISDRASNSVESIVPQLIDPTQIPLPEGASIQEMYQINDYSTYNNLIVLPDAHFSQVVTDGVNQYFIVLNNAILSVNPDLMNLFI